MPLKVVSFATYLTKSTKVAGVAETAERSGEAKKGSQPREADKQFLDIGISDKPDEVKAALSKLDGFIAKYPDYPDAYFLRATYKACILNRGAGINRRGGADEKAVR